MPANGLAKRKVGLRRSVSASAFVTAIVAGAVTAHAAPAVFFNADLIAGEQTFRDTAAAADAAYNAANPGATQSSDIFRIDLTNVTGSNFAVTNGGTTVYVKTTRAGSAAPNNQNGDEGGDGFTNWSVGYTPGDFNSAISQGYTLSFFSDSAYTSAYNVNAIGLHVSDWGTCCTANNAVPGGGTANASQIYMLFNGSTPLLVGGISTSIRGEEHFVAAIDDRNSFNSVTMVPNGRGEAFGAGGVILFSTLQLNSVPTGSSVVTLPGGTPTPTPPPLISTGHTYTEAQVIGGTVAPVFDGGTLRPTSSTTLPTNLTVRGTGGTIDTAANNVTLTGTIANASGAAGPLIKDGTGTLTLTGTNSYSGGTTVNGGTLRGSTTSLQGDMVNHATIDFVQPGNGTYAGTISGDGAVTKSGVGELTLTTAQTFTGNTTVDAGTLKLDGNGSIASSRKVVVDGALNTAGHNGDVLLQSVAGAGNVTLGANKLILASAADRFDGTIAGTGGVSVTGGTQQLAGANTFTGRTVIASGATLGLAGDGSLATSSGVTARGTFDIAPHNGDATIRTLDGAGNVTLGANKLILTDAVDRFDGTIAGTGGVSVTGGTQQLAGANTFTGRTVIAQNAALGLAGDGSLATSSGVTANGTFDIAPHNGDATIRTLDGAGNVTLGGNKLILTNAADRFDGTIAGTGGVTVTGGTQQLAGANTFTGRTVIAQNAALGLAGDGSLATSSGVTANGTFDIAPHNGDATIRTLDGAGNVTLGGNKLILTNAADRFDGTIAGTGGVSVAGGTQQLAGGNTFTGRTVIASGAALGLAGDGSLATSSGVTANGTFDIAPHNGDAAIRTLDGTGNVTLGGNKLILTSAADRFDGTIAGTGGVSVTGGTQQLAGANTFAGRTMIASGAALGLAGDGSLATSSGVTANGTFDIAPHNGDAAIRTLDGTGNVTLGGNKLILTNAADRFDGTIAGTGGVSVAGGTQQLAGANTFTGGTSIARGAALVVSGGKALADTGTLRNNGTLTVLSSEQVGPISGSGTIRLAGATLGTRNDGDTLYAGAITGTGGLTKTGAGILALSGDNSMTGGLTIADGTVAVARAANLGNGPITIGAAMLATAGNLSTDNGVVLTDAASAIDTLGHDVTLAGTVSGDGTLNKLGNGTLTLTGVNAQNGINVRGGTLAFSSDAALGKAGSVVTIEDNTTLHTLADMTITHAIQVQNTKLAAFDTGAHDIVVSGNILGSGIVQKTGAGTLTLTGTNSQVVIDVLGGRLLATQQSAIGAAGGDIYLRQDSRFSAGADMAITQNVHVTGTNAVMDTGDSTVRLLGALDGNQCLIKQGAGQLNLLAAASNAIGACVQQGTLSFNNNFAGNVWVEKDGTAGGSGAINGGMEVRGTLAPGNSPGRLVVSGSVTQFAGSTFAVDVDGDTPGIGAGHYDTLVLNGAGSVYTAAGTIAPKLRGITGDAGNAYTPAIGQTFTVVTAQGGVTGSYAALTQPTAGLAANSRFDVLYAPNAVVLTVTAASYARLFQGTNGNAASVGGAIDGFRGAAGVRDTSDKGTFTNGLMALSTAQLSRTLSQASGEIYADAMDAVVQSSRLTRTSVSDHLLDTAVSGSVGSDMPVSQRLWGTIAGATQQIDGDGFGQGYRGTGTTMTIGIDKNVSDHALIGGGVSYARSNASASGLGQARMNSYQLIAYAQWQGHGIYANGVLSSGIDRYKVSRAVQLSNDNARLASTPRGASIGGDLEIGAPIRLGRLDLTPALGLAYDRLDRRALGERGDTVTALSAGTDRREAFQLRSGVRLSTSFDLGGAQVRPYASAFAVRELADAYSTIDPTLYGQRFSVRAANAGDTAFRGAVGVDVAVTPGVSLRASYRYGDAANAHSDTYAGGISVRW
ncbi:autotransporter domain-containing protein [uncultured Sphingomonas sp.]|uniref:autotransporter domain-containing protein n=1 Tax=uncultured Sphingomonas sp. TaxID=158754 RepID=UPI0025D7256D|nr:autotransporter domain-containing protein [uncultured Sphingomonas sp.]